MAILYTCRYCTFCSILEGGAYTDTELGFDLLTSRERKAIITNNVHGDTRVCIVCDTCQHILENNPELSLLPHFYH